ncbi:beta-ketoacyl-ACP synthase III [Endozoicomonas arenosclerae]|uniref:beta-ketoacyl-ACP synthase III n=1 Tax=Endozoicomonas arenosclerae TaxID=1633495 RepID=UPI0007836754|nr:beta-ketoacyl-ACP synthase III [Endozoicomonas arenosclerae]
MDVYINSTGHYLPGDPIDNETVEEVLGYVHGKPSRLKRRILKANGIQRRHYAINALHETQISNSGMAARAGFECLDQSYLNRQDISLLSCATSQGDLVLPGFGSMVQAAMEIPDVELFSSHGICSSSMMALKTAYLHLKEGEHSNALVIASELASRLFKASRYEAIQGSGAIDFNAEFLRWMLSDGAGALLLENKPRKQSFKIEWIKSFSHADSYPTCMSVGSPLDSSDTRTWQDYATYAEAEAAGCLLIRQDVRLLENIVKLGADGYLRLLDKGFIQKDEVDHVLCHYSSHHFRNKIFEILTMAGAMIPEEKWYTNLYTRGNTGCASIFIMLDEFRRTQSYEEDDTLLCMVPESGRFNNVYMKLTVVGESS